MISLIAITLGAVILSGCSFDSDLEKQVEENTIDIRILKETVEDYENYKGIVDQNGEDVAGLKFEFQNHELMLHQEDYSIFCNENPENEFCWSY